MKHEESHKLLEFWTRAASELGIKIEFPFNLKLSSGEQLNAIMLVRYFGGDRGMLIFDRYQYIADHIHEIVDFGYGFSILREPADWEKYNIGNIMRILIDWGWYGEINLKPEWMNKK